MTFRKRAGCCLACQTPVWEIHTTFATGPMVGMPQRVGKMLPPHTLLRFLLLNGSTMDFTFCVDCAATVTRDDFTPIMTAQLEYEELAFAQNADKWHADAPRVTAHRRNLAMLLDNPIVALWTAVRSIEDLALETVDRRVRG